MKKVVVELGPRSYGVHVGAGLLPQVGAFARAAGATGSQALMVTDENTAEFATGLSEALFLDEFRTTHLTLPAGEAEKNLERASQLYDALAGRSADRQALVVACGGGVVGDLAGFVAATYNRGLPWLVVPTSLLAMVDSSIGGKTGVNHPRGKNLIGAFHQPLAVVADLDTLASLPDREYRSGLAEVVKYGFSLDEAFFSLLEQNATALLQRDLAVLEPTIVRCVELKARIVAEDERETTGRRAVLNFGHTFGHAFEVVAGYGSWTHGEAVAAGMVCASRLAERLELAPSTATARLMDLLERLGLPTRPDPNWPIADLLHAKKGDKKAKAGKQRFVLPRRVGFVELKADVPESQVEAVLRDLGGR